MGIALRIGGLTIGGASRSQPSLFTELIDGIPVSMIKRVRTKDAVELYVVDLRLTDSPGFAGVEDTDYEMIYGRDIITGIETVYYATHTYYVANAGDDAADGLTEATAWQTIAKVNAADLVGFRVLFNKGDIWREQLTVPSSGDSSINPITFGAYGIGALPIISGNDIVTGWSATPNLVTHPDDLDFSAEWGNNAVTVTADATTDPEGNSTAERLVGTNASHRIYQAITVTENTAYTFSFYAKNNGGTVAKYCVYRNTALAVNIIAPTSYFSQINNDTWTKITVNFTTPAGCISINVYVVRDSGDGLDLFISHANLALAVSSKAGYAANPNVIVKDGALLANYDAVTDLNANTKWYWDAAAESIFLFGNPGSSVMEIGSRVRAASFNGRSYVVLDGLEFQGGTGSSVTFPLSTANCIIKNCTVKNSYYGIDASSSVGNGNSVLSNTISYNMMGGIVVTTSATGWIIDSNDVSYSGRYHEQLESSAPQGIYTSAVGVIVQNNIVHHNVLEFAGITTPYNFKSSSHGIYVSGASIVRYNKCYNNLYNGIKLNPGSNSEVYYNLIYANNAGLWIEGTGVKIWNNVIYGNSSAYGSGAGFGLILASVAIGSELYNNIIMDNQYSGGANGQYNIYVTGTSTVTAANNNLIYLTAGGNIATYQTVTKTFAQWQTLGFDANGINDNPDFVSVNDFHLQAGSPAINAGVDVGLTEDYEGNPIVGVPDIGAYEKQ